MKNTTIVALGLLVVYYIFSNLFSPLYTEDISQGVPIAPRENTKSLHKAEVYLPVVMPTHFPNNNVYTSTTVLNSTDMFLKTGTGTNINYISAGSGRHVNINQNQLQEFQLLYENFQNATYSSSLLSLSCNRYLSKNNSIIRAEGFGNISESNSNKQLYSFNIQTSLSPGGDGDGGSLEGGMIGESEDGSVGDGLVLLIVFSMLYVIFNSYFTKAKL